jgi:hypothetical protein
MDAQLRQQVLGRSDAETLTREIRKRTDHQSLRASAEDLVKRGLTDEAELHRVLGSGGGGE